MGLVAAPPRSAFELRRRQLQGAGLRSRGRDGPTGRHRGRSVGSWPLRDRACAPAPPDTDAAPARRTARRRPGGRVRQADSGRAGRAGDGSGQPRLPARPVRDHQGLRRACTLHVSHRGEQVLQGEPLLRPQQPQGHHAGHALLAHLRLHRPGSGHGFRTGIDGPRPRRHPRVVQRLLLAGRGQDVQPLRHPAALRPPPVRGVLVRDRYTLFPDRGAVRARGRFPGPGRAGRHRRPVVHLRRGQHRD